MSFTNAAPKRGHKTAHKGVHSHLKEKFRNVRFCTSAKTQRSSPRCRRSLQGVIFSFSATPVGATEHGAAEREIDLKWPR